MDIFLDLGKERESLYLMEFGVLTDRNIGHIFSLFISALISINFFQAIKAGEKLILQIIYIYLYFTVL